ncbi:MAG: hypothetical protein IKU02_01105 [Bacteroidaceae bacterium]|nr:hypothetical protein [Bacteroidaceae bacterium]
MKKKYIIPETKVFFGEVTVMLSISGNDGDGNQFAKEFDWDDEDVQDDIWN